MGEAAAKIERAEAWPAHPSALSAGQSLVKRFAKGRWALVPDGDVDGLSAGALAYLALERLGASVVPVLPGKGEHVHQAGLRARILEARPDALVVLDMGSRGEPKGRLAGVEKLRELRAEVASEVLRCARSKPFFAPRVVLFSFRSSARVHPLVAVRAAARFPDRIVIAANYDYLPGRVNFAMRSRAEPDLLRWLRDLGAPLVGDTGHGHPGATGGSMPFEDFARLLAAMGFSEVPRP